MRALLLLVLLLAACAEIPSRVVTGGPAASPYGWDVHCAEERGAKRSAPECEGGAR